MCVRMICQAEKVVLDDKELERRKVDMEKRKVLHGKCVCLFCICFLTVEAQAYPTLCVSFVQQEYDAHVAKRKAEAEARGKSNAERAKKNAEQAEEKAKARERTKPR